MVKNKTNSDEQVSKMTVDKKDLKSDTLPNPVVTCGLEAIGLTRIDPIEIPRFLLMHPALPRGIEMKANRIMKFADEDLQSNVIQNPSGSSKSQEARDYCRTILENSGGSLFIKKMTQGAFRFGTSFSILQTNKKETEVLKFEYQHEIFFGAARYPTILKGPNADWGDIPMILRPSLLGKMKIDPKTKEIAKFTQLTKRYPDSYETNYKAQTDTFLNTRKHLELKTTTPSLVAVGNEINQSQVITLAFDTIGDEPLGIPLIQFIHLTIKYLLEMERGAAQTIVNFGFNKWKAKTPFKDKNKMDSFAQSLSRINVDAVVVLPKDVELDNIIPGQTEFAKIHPIYLKLIAMRLGIPLPLLTQDSTETNKATIKEQRVDMYDDFIADERTIEQTLNDGFFKACKIKWPELTVKELDKIVPRFNFNPTPEDLNIIQKRDLEFSLMIRNYSMSTQMFGGNKDWKGDPKVVKALSDKILELLELSMSQKKLSPAGKPQIEPDSGNGGSDGDSGE